MLRFFIFLFFVVGASNLQAQILDDSTRVVYGPNSTSYLKEENILYNDLKFTVIDTSANNSHRWSMVEKSEYKLQDLGVSGTAIRNIYYKLPQLIGARSGYAAYVPYYRPISDFKYYDTKSPYSKIMAAIGSRNRTVVDVGFNRSDSSNFNIGIDYFNYNSDKQVASIGKNDKLVKNEGFDAYLFYFTPQRRYLVMANFSRMKTNAFDQGGIKIDTLNPELGYFDRDANVFLENAGSEYLKKTYHLYHQFRVNKALQVYQVFDRSYDQTKFIDDPLTLGEIDYFDSTYLNNKATNDSTLFETISLENGVKGTIGKLFYSAHYRYRIYSFQYGADTLDFKTNKPAQDGIEHYIGGRVRYDFSPDYQLYGGIDFNLNGNQKLWGKVRFKGLQGDFVTQQYEPSFMEKAYLGNHDYWVNDFKTIKALQMDGSYTHYFKNNSFIKPKATFTSFTDYVYYNKEAVPAQLDGTSTLLTLGAKFLISPLNRLYIEGEGLYTTVTGDSTQVFPVPKIMANLNVYLHDISYGGNLDWQIGIENHWKSDYFAPDYRVSTNQFFIQDNFNVEAYLISDFYINVKVGHAFVFLKYNNIWGTINGETYFAAPNYVGKKSLVDYGFYWMFFD